MASVAYHKMVVKIYAMDCRIWGSQLKINVRLLCVLFINNWLNKTSNLNERVVIFFQTLKYWQNNISHAWNTRRIDTDISDWWDVHKLFQKAGNFIMFKYKKNTVLLVSKKLFILNYMLVVLSSITIALCYIGK